MDLITIVLLAAHLLAVNVAAGGPLVAIWLEWKARGGRDALAARSADFLAKWSVLSLLAGAVLGLLLGVLFWNDSYRHLWLDRLWHKVSWGLAELGCSFVAMSGYWLWRACRTRAGTMTAAARMVLLLFAATNLLYHFPPLFLVAGRMSDAGATAGAPVTPAIFRQEMVRGEVPALSTHFVLASLAVTGVMLLRLALYVRRCGGSDEDDMRLTSWGGRIALVSSVLQLPVGLWVLSSVGASIQNRLMGGHPAATACFLVSVAGALWLMRELVAVALGERERSQIVRAMALMVSVVVLMTAGQHFARARTAPVSHPPAVSGFVPPSPGDASGLH